MKYLIARLILTSLVGLVVFTACGPVAQSPLEKTALGLKAGMTKKEVAALFKDFDFVERQGGDLTGVVLFQINVQAETRVSYFPKDYEKFGRVEDCTVYFDEHNIIVGYSYGHS